MELLLFSRPYIILVVCSNNVCILHCFQDITTFTVYVTACDFLDKSFIFDKTDVCTSGFTCKFIRAIFPKIWEAERFQTTKVTLKVPRGLLASCHSIWQIDFSLCLYGPSNERQIRSRTHSIKWWHCRWPCVTIVTSNYFIFLHYSSSFGVARIHTRKKDATHN